MKFFKDKKIYLDYAGTTPVSSKVMKAISSPGKELFANPSAIHGSGVEARNIINESREKIAKLIHAHSDEIIFTGSGTESDALAIVGLVSKIRENKESFIPHIVTTNIEHPAVLENCRFLEESGKAEVTYVPVDKNGIVNPKNIKEAIKENSVLVSVMYANNEIGTIQPISEIAKEIRYYRKGKTSKFPLFHTDACQAINYLPMENIEKLGVDLLSFNSSKIYGPKGIGVLYKKRGVDLSPLYRGGGQELGLRPGTENILLISGIAVALEETMGIREKESLRLIKIRDGVIKKLMDLQILPFKIILNGDSKKRLPNNINISISNISSELLVLELDAQGIHVSEKSACHSGDDNGSYVIKAIRKICGRKKDSVQGSLRISLGRQTTKKDMDIFMKAFVKILNKYKNWK